MVVVLGAVCTSPVDAPIAKPRAIHRYLTQSVLSADEPSLFSQIELRRHDLQDAFHDDLDAALARRHEVALEQGLPAEALFTLSELSFLHADDDCDAVLSTRSC
jgi:hypothetical protein